MTDCRISNFDNLPDAALISMKELMALSGRSRTSLWRDVLHEHLADPIVIGSRTVKWRVSDVKAFLSGVSNDG